MKNIKKIRLHPSLPTVEELEQINKKLAREVAAFITEELHQREKFALQFNKIILKKAKTKPMIDGGKRIRIPLNYDER